MSRRPKNKIKKNNQISQAGAKPNTSNILDRISCKTREIANKLLHNKWQTPQPVKTKYRKQKIPIALRQACWVRQFGETYQHKCFVDWCHRKITCFDFEVGHNLPESKGGTLDLDNLRPICRQCNIGMGNMYTIDEWRLLKIKS
jgi:5-methylcytosine-specific restriction endonuclease McrA